MVVASGGYHEPIVPRMAERLPGHIAQIHSAEYRNADQLPDGAVLVVGSGQSGAQIAEDLHLAGRKVVLAVGHAPRCARFYRGRDVVTWLADMGYYEMSVEQHPLREGVRDNTNHYVTGRDGGRDIDLRKFAAEGMELYGVLRDYDGASLVFDTNLASALDDADRTYNGINAAIDKYIAEQAIEAPPPSVYEPVWTPAAERPTLDLAASGIGAIVWCIGFKPDFRWLDAPVFNGAGHPAAPARRHRARRRLLHRPTLAAHMGLRPLRRRRARCRAHRRRHRRPFLEGKRRMNVAISPDALLSEIAAPTLRESVLLGMPQLSLSGLSESWLLKDLGHRHWMLLARLAGRAVPDFRDADGAPVYAAFCALSVKDADFAALGENDRLTIVSDISRVSRTQSASRHRLSVAGKPVGEVELVSAFVRRASGGGNHTVARVALDAFPPPVAPRTDGLAALAADLRAGRQARHFGFDLHAAEDETSAAFEIDPARRRTSTAPASSISPASSASSTAPNGISTAAAPPARRRWRATCSSTAISIPASGCGCAGWRRGAARAGSCIAACWSAPATARGWRKPSRCARCEGAGRRRTAVMALCDRHEMSVRSCAKAPLHSPRSWGIETARSGPRRQPAGPRTRSERV